MGLHQRERARRLLRRRHERARGRDRLHRAGTAEHADPGPREPRPRSLDRLGRRRRRASILHVLPRPGDHRGGTGLALAHRVLRGARLRAVPAPRARDRGLGSGRGRRGHALRRGHHRARAGRDRHGRHRLRLRASSPDPVRPRPRPARRPRRRRVVHGQGAAARRRGRSAEPIRHDPARGDDTARVRRRGDRRWRGCGGADEPGDESEARRRSVSRSCGPRWRHPAPASRSRCPMEPRSVARSTCWPCTTRRSNAPAPDGERVRRSHDTRRRPHDRGQAFAAARLACRARGRCRLGGRLPMGDARGRRPEGRVRGGAHGDGHLGPLLDLQVRGARAPTPRA